MPLGACIEKVMALVPPPPLESAAEAGEAIRLRCRCCSSFLPLSPPPPPPLRRAMGRVPVETDAERIEYDGLGARGRRRSPGPPPFLFFSSSSSNETIEFDGKKWRGERVHTIVSRKEKKGKAFFLVLSLSSSPMLPSTASAASASAAAASRGNVAPCVASTSGRGALSAPLALTTTMRCQQPRRRRQQQRCPIAPLALASSRNSSSSPSSSNSSLISSQISAGERTLKARAVSMSDAVRSLIG